MQFGLTPDKIGIVFLANAIPYAACAPLSGLLADKIVSVKLIHTLLSSIHTHIFYAQSFLQNPRFIVVCGLLVAGVGYLLIGPSPIIPLHPYVSIIIWDAIWSGSIHYICC